jgi:NAD(P)-dependent dehydrogenase (short-subunit alcohol dehydrogenase family)
MDELRFDERVVIITGAHHGLGRAYAEELATRGAQVVVNDIQGATDSVAAIRELGGEAIEDRHDITTSAGTDAIVAAAREQWGRVDAVINNAAGGPAATLVPENDVHATLGVHFVGTTNLIRSALPVFRQQGYGRVVNTSSGSIFGIPGTGTYASAKGAVLAYTKVLANELGEDPELDVKVNAVLPTALTPIMPRVPDEAFQAMLDRAFSARRVAPLVALLAHPDCPVTGEALQVGGGRVARVILATTEGWQAPEDEATPEMILANWDSVMAGRDLREPIGSLADLLARRGEPPFSTHDLVSWARTGVRPDKRSD